MTLNNSQWFGSTAGFYNGVATQSLRFNDDDSAFLTRTPSSASNRKTWTWSGWIKRSSITSTAQIFFGARTVGNGTYTLLFFEGTTDYLYLIDNNGTLRTSSVYRDPSAWYHVVFAVDTTQATNTDRLKLYVNGTQITAFNIATYPSQNTDLNVNSTATHFIGKQENQQYLDGYLAEVNFVDGLQLDPTYFGESKNGVWIPKEYTGSYGTNGFRLEFNKTGTGTASASTIGADTSGNTNHFTSSGIVASDCNMPDSPENNFATLNPLDPFSGTLSEGNLKYANTNSFKASRGNFEIPSSGKWYFEVLNTTATDGDNAIWAGVAHQDTNISAQPNNGSTTKFYGLYNDSSLGILSNGSQSSYTTNQISANGIIQIAIDTDNDKLYVGINNSYYTNATTSASFNASNSTESIDLSGYRPFVGAYQNTGVLNCGQDSTFAGTISAGGNSDANGKGDFKYAPPSGFLALCTSNLPEPTISPNADTQADDYFSPTLYTSNNIGAGGTQNVTGVGFQPDWVWIKNRSSSGTSHTLFDSVRAEGKMLQSDNANEEASNSQYGYLSSFDSDGFTLTGGTTNANFINQGTDAYVSWNWKANGTTPTKTYKVKVVSDSTDYGHGTGSNKYQFFKSDGSTGFGTNGVDLDLQEGGTYTFDWSDSSAQSHPIRFSLTNDGTHSSGTSAGSEYTTGVVKDDSAYTTTITVASGVANLYYYCQNHSGMGAEIRTNTTHGSTNFDGSNLSVSNANTTAGFSIVSYTGNSTAGATVGHGLGSVPNMIIVKCRSNSSSSDHWYIYHSGIASNAQNWEIYLNLTNQAYQNVNLPWNNTAPTSSVFSLGSLADVNQTSETYIAYVFAEVEGYSKFGSYTGSSGTVGRGTFINLGFRPSFVVLKDIDGGEWGMFDSARNTFNVVNKNLTAESTANEYSSDSNRDMDFLSNGFKLMNAYPNGLIFDNSARSYIYMAFAETPFKYANAR